MPIKLETRLYIAAFVTILLSTFIAIGYVGSVEMAQMVRLHDIEVAEASHD